MKNRILCILLLVLAFASCGEYNKILKSPDPEVKYTYAKKYFDERKYGRTQTLLEDILPLYTGLSKEQEIRFLLAQAYFYSKDYEVSTMHYTQYFNKFPKGEYTELARFNAAYGQYLNSPDVQLDQTSTVNAIQGFQSFTEYHPQSEKAKDAQNLMFELQEKLAYKEFLSATLYYNLGLYLGNNYESCVVTAKEALKRYPFSVHADDFQFLVVKARYELASQSIEEKKPVRYRELLDEYYNYTNMFPEGKYLKDVAKFHTSALRYLNKTESIELIDDAVESELSENQERK